MSKFEDAYWGKEIAEILQIGDSTLRKWCLSLENQGHVFMRGQHNSRAFVERDLLILRRMKELIQNKGITLETASEIECYVNLLCMAYTRLISFSESNFLLPHSLSVAPQCPLRAVIAFSLPLLLHSSLPYRAH